MEERGFVKRTNGNVFVKERLKAATENAEDTIIEHVKSKGFITRSEVAQMLNVSPSTALRILVQKVY
ncbi:MAG: hypothetical protein ACK4FU_08425 [Fervidobacterium gondwanense]